MRLNLHKGGIVGTIASISYFNIAIFGPILLLASAALLPIRRPLSQDKILVSLVVLQMLYMATIQVFLGNMNFVENMAFFLGGIILLVFIFLRGRSAFITSYLKAAYVLFVVDFAFNLTGKLIGTDPFGRSTAIRPDDILTRVGGLFGHPFVSVQIAVIGVICGVALNKRWMIILACTGLLINGTLRSPLSFCLLVVLYFVIRLKPTVWVIVLVSVAFAALVVLLTFYTASDSVYINGNFYRLFAWQNAIINIAENWIFGKHDLATGPITDFSFETIVDFGIAESYYLTLWLRYGISAPALSLVIFLIILKRAVKQYRSAPQDPFLKAKLMLAAFVLCDTFYGNFFGAVLTTTAYAMLCTSYEHSPDSLREHIA